MQKNHLENKTHKNIFFCFLLLSILLIFTVCSQPYFSNKSSANSETKMSNVETINNVNDLYAKSGTDYTWDYIINNNLIPINQQSTTGITGSTIDVRNDLVEVGLYGNRPIENNIQIHTVGHSTIYRNDFHKWSRWYQEDGNTQIFRLFEGEYNVRNTRRPYARIEAEIKPYTDGSQGEWTTWSGRYTIIDIERIYIFQIWGYSDWKPSGSGLMMLQVNSAGHLQWNVRDGNGTTYNIIENVKGKTFDLMIRDNGLDYELYIDGDLIGTHRLERTGPSHFRWGLYCGTGDVVKGNPMIFVSGAQINGEPVTSSSSSSSSSSSTSRFNLPGTIQAEDYHDYYDTTPGNQGGAYRNDDVDIQECDEGGFNVGWIAASEWLDFNVNTASSGNYLVECRVASLTNNIKYNILQDSTVIASVDSPSTGDWQTWTTVSSEVGLTGGQSTIRIAMTGGSWNLNWIKITKIDDTPIGPEGYTYCCMENESYTFTSTVDVAYGANGQFVYESGITGTITFNNTRFGDPIHGVKKAGFYKIAASSSSSSSSISSSSSSSGNITVLTNNDKDKAYNVNGIREFQIPTGGSGVLQVKKPWKADVQFSINGGAYKNTPQDWGGEYSVPANSNIKVKVKTPSAMDVQFNWW